MISKDSPSLPGTFAYPKILELAFSWLSYPTSSRYRGDANGYSSIIHSIYYSFSGCFDPLRLEFGAVGVFDYK